MTTKRGAGYVVLAIVAWMATAFSPATSVRAAGAQQPDTSSDSAIARAAINRYCVTCHNQRTKTAGLTLDTLDLDDVARDGEAWDKVLRKLRSRAMPPAGGQRPDDATYQQLVAYLESAFDRHATLHPSPGHIAQFRRLTRTEYANAVRDLLALDQLPKELDLATLLPADNSATGFDNLADLLFVSPTAMEAYLAAARKLSRLAVGDLDTPAIVDRHLIPDDLPQDVRLEGAPVGTRGGLFTKTYLPIDGEYRLRIEFAGNARERHDLEVTVDGQQVKVFTLGTGPPPERGSGVFVMPPDKPVETTVPMKAGPHDVGVAWIEQTPALSEALVRPRLRSRGTLPAIAAVTLSGPHNAAGASDTPSRRRLFVCVPPTQADEMKCARQILSTLVRRGYRRAASEDDLALLLPFFEAGRREAGFERGIQQALERVLISPQFLFRIERDPAAAPTRRLASSRGAADRTASAAAVSPVSDIELASRLSFFLWSSIPDDELLDLAIAGKLREPAALAGQVRRMLADARSEALVTNFAAQWLFLRDVDEKRPDERMFPDFDAGLRQAMRRETELFIDSVIREGRSALDLLTADYTFVNERLARHYGIPNVYGPDFRRVRLADGHRRGLLGKGSVLLLTSYSTRTSPVLRGKYVLGNLLGDEPPPPPPNVPSLDVSSRQSGKPLSMREAMQQHRANPVCSTCHARMDPIGFALDNFDALGRWRTISESGAPIDASGRMPDGTTFNGVDGLRDFITARPYEFVNTMTEKLLTYAIGRSLEYYDGAAVRAVLRRAEPEGYRLSSLILGIVESTPFQMRASVAAQSESQVASRP